MQGAVKEMDQENIKNMDWVELAVKLYFKGYTAKKAILEAIKIKDMEGEKNADSI